MAAGASNAGGDNNNVLSIPRGGPIYVDHAVGPLTRVPWFQDSVLGELNSLEAEIGWDDSGEACDDEIQILVDDLKIIKEEDLVKRAFEEAFRAGEPSADVSSENGGGMGSETLHPSSTSASENPNSNKTTSRNQKRKRPPARDPVLEEGYVAKVQEFARIKQKQDEDKAAARLHSFDGAQNQRAACLQEKNNRLMSIKSTSSSAHVRSSPASEHVPVHFPEVVLCVEVYNNRRTLAKSQEFLVLGRQFLSELKDKIYCLTDEIMKGANEHDLSGYFLIEDVFFRDTRDACAVDYTRPIFEWLEHSRDKALQKWECIASGEPQKIQKQKCKAFPDMSEKVELPRFKALEMHKTRFCDLSFSLGAGYLYCHQGNCKHVIIIRDMRLIHPEDVQNRAAYPLIRFQSKLRFRKCSVCNIYKATKFTVDDKWAKENPCYFCELCYYMLHYAGSGGDCAANGEILYKDFDVYEYFHE